MDWEPAGGVLPIPGEPDGTMKIFVKGLNSCGMRRTNVQRYIDYLSANGHEIVAHPNQSDITLLWTCAFRGDFRDNSLAEIRRYLNEFDTELIVAGCLPDIDRQRLLEEFPGRVLDWRDEEAKMERFFGANGKRFNEIPLVLGEAPLCDDVDAFKKENPGKEASFVDQFIKLFVAEGCRFTCTYCAEILAFPPYRSFPEEVLIETCRELVERTGRYRVMLLGDSIGDYGCDTGSSLPALIRRLQEVDARLRFGLQGFNPAHFVKHGDDMAAFLRSGTFCHLQLPIQSASERILAAINRPYCRADIDRVFALLQEMAFTAIDTHLIIGFPGETDEDFEESLAFVLQYRPHYVLVSQYMETPAMPSSHLPDKVSAETKKRRLERAAECIKGAGILCNTDDSELSLRRCQTLNRIEKSLTAV